MEQRHFLDKFTVPGRLLVTSALLLGAGGTVAYIVWSFDSLSPGSYPLLIFIVPVALCAVLYFALGVTLFKLLKIRVWKDEERS